MQLELNADERDVILGVLESASSTLREEIYKAEVMEFKAMLRAREDVVVRLMGRVRELAASPV